LIQYATEMKGKLTIPKSISLPRLVLEKDSFENHELDENEMEMNLALIEDYVS